VSLIFSSGRCPGGMPFSWMEHMYLSVCFVSPQAHTHGHGATPEMSDKDARRFLSRKQRMGAAAAVAASRGGTRKNLPHAAEVGNREGDPVIALRDTVVHPPLFPKSLWFDPCYSSSSSCVTFVSTAPFLPLI
jgi:hypothetical protein